MTDELLPCPFCGGEAAMNMPTHVFVNDPQGPTYSYWIYCNCPPQKYGDLSGEGCTVKNDRLTIGRITQTPEDAIERWNRRAPWLPPEDVETLKEIVGWGATTGSDRYMHLKSIEAIISKLEGGK